MSASTVPNIWEVSISQMTTEQMWENYEACLKAHDWTYEFSDDHSVWQAGAAQRQRLSVLQNILKAKDPERESALYLKYNVWFNRPTE